MLGFGPLASGPLAAGNVSLAQPTPGGLNVTLAPATLSATGTVAISGSLSATLAPATLVATGAVADPPPMDGSRETEAADWRVTETGGVIRLIEGVASVGTLDATLGNATLSATGTLGPIPNTGALGEALRLSQLGDIRLTELGDIRGIDGAATLANATLVGTGALGPVPLGGTLNQTLANATLVGTGKVTLGGVLNQTLANATLVGTAKVLIQGALGDATRLTELGDIRLTELGDTRNLDGRQTLANATLVGTGALGPVPLSGVLNVTLANATLAGSAKVLIQGALGETLRVTQLDAVRLTELGDWRNVDGGRSTADATLVATGVLGPVPIYGVLGEAIRETEAGIVRLTEADDIRIALSGATLAAATLVASGFVFTPVVGVSVGFLNAVPAPATLAGTGSLGPVPTATGTLTRTLDPATLAATGSSGYPVHGTLARTLAPATLVATGTTGGVISPPRFGTLVVTLADATLVATGHVPAYWYPDPAPPCDVDDWIEEAKVAEDWTAGTARCAPWTATSTSLLDVPRATEAHAVRRTQQGQRRIVSRQPQWAKPTTPPRGAWSRVLV